MRAGGFSISTTVHRAITLVLVLVLALSATMSAAAVERVKLRVVGGDDALEEAMRQASRVIALMDAERDVGPADVVGAALSDYRNLVVALYAKGHYSGSVRIAINGREAAEMPLLNLPARIESVRIRVEPGPAFRFGRVAIAPQPPGAQVVLPQRGDSAESERVKTAVRDTVDAWRSVGYAKARPDSERVIADHRASTLDVDIGIAPGPRVRFGNLVLAEPSAVRTERIRRIAGLPAGEVFSPEELERVATRLRRTGAFTSVSLSEAETLGPGDSLDIELDVADAKPRRFGFGAEISSFEGLELSAFWLHRNLLGGAERLRFDARVSNIGSAGGGVDYMLGARLDIPAVFGADTTGFLLARAEYLDEPDFKSSAIRVGGGASKIFSDVLQGEIGVNLEYSETEDDLGKRDFTLLTFPGTVTWDRRDNELDASEGSYITLSMMPFAGLNGDASGLQAKLDARAYRSFGAERNVVLAGRLQAGSVFGPALEDTRPDLLFSSGGGGTVRGQPYRSLTVDLGKGDELGGRSFLGLSAELRVKFSDALGGVAFADAGYIGAESAFDGSGDWHSGAGLGLRYQTGLGPIRLDVAVPTSGDTGDGYQLYIGIGQAF